LHPDHISRNLGEPGRFVGTLDPEEIVAIETRYREWLLRHGYPLSGTEEER
jgi:hypothetical protein